MSFSNTNRSRAAVAGKLYASALNLWIRAGIAVAIAALALALVASPVTADDGNSNGGGLLGGLLGGGSGSTGGLTDPLDDIVDGTVGEMVDSALSGDVGGAIDAIVGGDAIGDIVGGAPGGDLIGGDLLGADLLGADLSDVGGVVNGTVGPEGLGVLKETEVCLLNCPKEDGQNEVVDVKTGVSGNVAPNLIPETDVEACVPAPCGSGTGNALANVDVETRGSKVIPDADAQLCVAGDCKTKGREGNGLGIAHVGLNDNQLLPGAGIDACVAAKCEGNEYKADALLGGVIRLYPGGSLVGNGLVATSGAEVCLLGTCEHDGRYRSGVLTIDLVSEHDGLLPGLNGVICILAVCERPSDPTNGQPPTNGGEHQVAVDPGSSWTFEPPAHVPPVGGPVTGPTAPQRTIADTTVDGGTKFPLAGFAPALGDALSDAASRWPLAIAALLAVAAGWFTRLRALRRSRQ